MRKRKGALKAEEVLSAIKKLEAGNEGWYSNLPSEVAAIVRQDPRRVGYFIGELVRKGELEVRGKDKQRQWRFTSKGTEGRRAPRQSKVSAEELLQLIGRMPNARGFLDLEIAETEERLRVLRTIRDVLG